MGEIAKLVLKDLVNDKWELKEKVILKKQFTKTNKSRPFYVVHKELRASLTKLLEDRRKDITTNEIKDWKKKPLFVSQKGSPFSPKSLQKAIKVMFQPCRYTWSRSKPIFKHTMDN